MIKISNVIPEGTRDFTIDECIKRRRIVDKVTDIFDKWGYSEISTPTIEYYETFNHKTQSLKEEEMYKFFDNRGRILVLRPDMTVPVARMINTKFRDISLPVKLYYSEKVFRVHESLEGKKNEYLDCGIEFVGLDGKNIDLEVLVTAIETLKAIGNKKFKIEIGNVNISKAALSGIGINGVEKKVIMNLINNKSLISLKEALELLDISEENKEFLNKLPWLFGGYEMIEKAKQLSVNKNMTESIIYLEDLYLSLKELGYEKYITVDLSMVPRVDYYSGIIFKGYIDGIGKAILRGGRYNGLLKNFGQDKPAIGFSIDINELININYNNKNKYLEVTIDNNNPISMLKEAIIKTNEGKRVNIKYKNK
ncbi:ATP phosphoribosyltransferase regulatory subunit [Clostridium celatum]|uniref:ATP phosphoribosyltransferase regulatory subunit n=1 Tax=Clostridium celatum TaxID=36834 RepID=UPI002906F90D|nr:ATP phosphoribosyltransferase regulatory subunit [Clostridium celatum]MDU6294874.1 ATP phosphoribosyltransferase regulatory subunit [Clostridium celatum]MDY3361060.1 ATP phosphoribosyltransferase regulatory subunit [Clostridium celatum]